MVTTQTLIDMVMNQEGRSKKKTNDLTQQRQQQFNNVVINGGQASASETLGLEHKRRLQDPLRLQRENYEEWNQIDFDQFRQSSLRQDFTNQDSNEENLWEYANFNPGGSYECPAPQIINSWTTSKLTGTNRGLLIRSQIIKTIPRFSLRSLAVSIQVKGRLFGNSMFWIFTRVSENIETNRPICIIKKMPDSQRVFCIFGQMIERTTSVTAQPIQHGYGITRDQYANRFDDTINESEKLNNSKLDQSQIQQQQQNKLQFKFFKNQEIPEFFYNIETDSYMKQVSSKAQQEDYVDFNMTMIDNGDDRVCLQVGLNDKKTLNLICQMYMPVFEPTKVLFSGSGHATYLKEVNIKQIQRQEYFKSGLKEGHFECCNTF
eukprot:403359216